MLRFGCHNFLNSLPILRGLKTDCEDYKVILDRPSALARMLHERRLDAAIVPSIEFLRNPDYIIVPDVCIAACGRVESVNLYYRKQPEEIGLIALDPASLTSVMLVKVLMPKRFGVRPRYSMAGHIGDMRQIEADAVLVIGDEALGGPPAGWQALDLAEQWYDMTRLPFVFALCCAHRGVNLERFDDVLRGSLVRGLDDIAGISAEAAPAAVLTKERLKTYLTHRIRYKLGPEEQKGLKRFFAEVVEANLWTKERDLEFYSG